jgi:D-alanine-D-alanine ligase
MSASLRRVVVLHNTDYDAELTAGSAVDVSAVKASAQSICDALVRSGLDASMVGMHGSDLFEVIGRLDRERPDLIFNLCESMCGDSRNEVTVPGVLELFRLRYTGADGLGLGSCLFKDRAKDILRGRGIPTPEARLLEDGAALADPALERLDYPWFLKLVHEDASVGIEADNVVHDRDALARRARYMMHEWRQPVLAERYIEGREVNVTLIGNGETLRMYPLHEIDFSAMPPSRPRIVSYAAKWEEGHVDYGGTRSVPIREVSPALAGRIEQVARGAWHAMGLRDYGRVDLRIDAQGNPFVIDVNPNCDISPDAGVARSTAAAGLAYHEMIRRIADVAWQRWQGATPS